jgi:hypothetical protein
MSDDDFENTEHQPKDPAQAFIEEVTYGDPSAAAQKLKDFVETEAAARNWRERFNYEQQSAGVVSQKAERENPDLAQDEDARALVILRLLREQAKEVAAAGVDMVKIYGREPTAKEIADHHTALRAQRWKGASTAQQLMDREQAAVRKLLGWRAPADSDPSRTIRERRLENSRLRGLPEPQEVDSETGARIEPEQHLSAEDVTLRDAGFGGTDPSADRRQSAFLRMQADRRRLRGGDYQSLDRTEKAS